MSVPNVLSGQVDVDTAAVALTSETFRPDGTFLIKAHSANTADVFVGSSSVTVSDGYALSAGEELTFTYSNIAADATELRPRDFYVAGTAGDAVSWLAIRG